MYKYYLSHVSQKYSLLTTRFNKSILVPYKKRTREYLPYIRKNSRRVSRIPRIYL